MATSKKAKAADSANKAMLDKALALKAKLETRLKEAEKTQADIKATAAADKAAQIKQTAADRLQKIKDERLAKQPENVRPSYNNVPPPVPVTVVPGSSGMAKGEDRTLAIDTFKNTLALFFGAQEMSKSWVNGLYNSVSNFYNSGSTIDESLNLSLQDIRNNPELKPFTDRFSGIYSLQDRLAKGEAIEVPTIAEYFKSESSMGDVLRQSGMGELATQDFLGKVLGAGKSVLEVTNLITDTFASIDNAPKALKDDLQNYFPGVSRVDMAKALLTGKEGAIELNKKIAAVSTLSAAKLQGVDISLAMAGDISASGYDYGKSLTAFGTVKRLEKAQSLGRMSGIDFNQEDAISAVVQSNVKAQDKITKIAGEEENRFSSRVGRLNSQNRAAGAI